MQSKVAAAAGEEGDPGLLPIGPLTLSLLFTR